ncbi:TonB-dependent receptor plug domain-containing protein [Neptunicella sp. SCSIO 80796]|uniref:TonB-dependent receptor plug domain-containing protein n=1 Tax=Neptunicella plasticusilytica TaxID=3117012 RepID=UPI003A4E0504
MQSTSSCQFRQIKPIIILLGFCLFSLSVSADPELTEQQLFDLSMDELINLQISVASGQQEQISNAPAVVSIITRQQMDNWGLHSVYDALSFLPGIQIQESAIGTHAIGIRGLVEPFSQKTLILLDGVPYWMPSHGDNGLSGIPVRSIDRIEVIRGPGAVIYGTNASAGVINIITRKDDINEVQLGIGTQGWKEFNAYGQVAVNNQLTFRLSAQWQDEDGYSGYFVNRPQPAFFPQVPPANAYVQKYQQKKTLLAQLEWQALNISFHQFESRAIGLAGPASSINYAQLNYTGQMLAANYTFETNVGHFELYADYNNFYLDIPTNALFGGEQFGTQLFDDNGDNNYRLRSGINWDYKLTDKLKFDVGLETEKRHTADYLQTNVQGEVVVLAMPEQSISESSLFMQLDYNLDKWRWVAGLRLVDNQGYGHKALPRLSLVKTLSEHQSLKALVSSGFNSPNMVQLYVDIPPDVVAGDPDLKAETVTSYELAYTYQKNDQLLVLNLFYLKAKDFIQRGVLPAGGVSYQNSENFERRGVEIDWQRQSDDWHWMLTGSYSPDTGKVNAGDISAAFMASLTMSAGLDYRIDGQQKIGTSLRYIGSRAEVDSLLLLNATYQFESGPHKIQLSAENLLGETIRYADIQDFVLSRQIPGGDGSRLASVRYSYRF